MALRTLFEAAHSQCTTGLQRRPGPSRVTRVLPGGVTLLLDGGLKVPYIEGMSNTNNTNENTTMADKITLKKICKSGLWQVFCNGTLVEVTVESALTGKGYEVLWSCFGGGSLSASVRTLAEARTLIDNEVLGG